MTCDDVAAAMPDLIDGGADDDVVAAATAHLATCDDCRLIVDETKGVGELYRTQGRLQLPADARARILDSVQAATDDLE